MDKNIIVEILFAQHGKVGLPLWNLVSLPH